MNNINLHSINIEGDYPVYRRNGENLELITTQQIGRRYSLTFDVKTGKTYYVEFTDAEEAEADRQKLAWEEGAVQREFDKQKQAIEAANFEESLRYSNRVIAFIDILGWKDFIQSKDIFNSEKVKVLGKAVSGIKWLADWYNSLGQYVPSDHKWPGNPILTHFSDSLVISVDDNNNGKEVLEQALSILSANLINYRMLLRGGIARGEVFHNGSLLFGPALIEAYQLESEIAIQPRVILSKELSSAWAHKDITGSSPWVAGVDGQYFFNFLPPFVGNPVLINQTCWNKLMDPFRNLILEKANDPTCPEKIFSKYLWLACYFDWVCEQYPQAGVEKILQTALQHRWQDSR